MGKSNEVDLALQDASASGGVNSDDDSYQAEEEVTIDKTLAKKESKAVTWLRLALFGVLIVATILVALAVYYYISNSEQRKFEDQFREEAKQIYQHMGTQLELSLGSLDQFSVSIMSYARALNQSLPFFVIPDMALRGEKFLRQTNFFFMKYYPYVTAEQRSEWEAFTEQHGREYLIETEEFMVRNDQWDETSYNASTTPVSNKIHKWNWTDDGYWAGVEPLPENHPGPFLPTWQSHTPSTVYPYNFDYLSDFYTETITTLFDSHEAVIGDSFTNDDVDWLYPGAAGEIFSYVLYPMVSQALDYLVVQDHQEILGNVDNGTNLLGTVVGQILWKEMLTSILPIGSDGLLLYMNDGCWANGTYRIDGPNATFLGIDDRSEDRFSKYALHAGIDNLKSYSTRDRSQFEYTGMPVADFCPFEFAIYPTPQYEARFKTNNPAIFTAVAVLIFAFTSFLFITYDWWVERRQRIVMGSAVRSSEVVASFYPKEVRDRIYKHNEEQKRTEEGPKGWNNGSVKGSIKGWHTASRVSRSGGGGASVHSAGDGADGEGGGGAANNLDAPIADFYPETTVMFADIAGFTSWSSTREPAAVFILLEGLYQEFDKVAKRMGVFKIETIGDCYLAVCGLPKPRKNHATVMARFAAECRDMFNAKTPELELTLGPGTADLLLRAGLHSGSCTGGVLRGEKCLFTLFGDTVNTASRMESNGKPNRIQVSQATADRLIANGKERWLTKRDDLITAKGKGKMQTYWVEPSEGAASISTLTDPEFVDMNTAREAEKLEIPEGPKFNPDHGWKQPESNKPSRVFIEKSPEAIQAAKVERLIDWNVSLVEDLLKKLVAHRGYESAHAPLAWQPSGMTPRQEVAPVLQLGDRNAKQLSRSAIDKAKLPLVVVQQLHNFISAIARSYHPNPFHNFEHTSHVTMSFRKLMQRISASKTLSAQDIFTYSFGLDTDPMAEIAVIFATLILNVKHAGIPNTYAIPEDPTRAARFGNVSLNEQSSLEYGWNMFMDRAYSDLRGCLFAKQGDLKRFRQLLVNVVMATDVSDPQAQAARDARWNAAFAMSPDDPQAMPTKATVVLEAVMQTSVLSHTMQHWTIYQKWNRCLYEERSGAYAAGRIPDEPASRWYQGELDFFDHVIIPLASKLEDRRIMGEYSHEFLGCALENRIEWESEGPSIVDELASLAPTVATSYFPPRPDAQPAKVVDSTPPPEQPLTMSLITTVEHESETQTVEI